MKKTLIGLSLISMFAFNAHAGPITFDETSVGGAGTGSVITVDGLDFDVETATVTQTDDGDGLITGGDNFVELGGTVAVNWLNDTATNSNMFTGTNTTGDYEIFIDYSIGGIASGLNLGGGLVLVQVNFDPAISTGTLYIDDDNPDGLYDPLDSETLGTFNAGTGSCSVVGDVSTGQFIVNSGGCSLDFDLSVEDGYFLHGADDLADLNPINMSFSVSVQSFNGLYFSYADQEAALENNLAGSGDGFNVQVFDIRHDGNLSFAVPEPNSIAALGLGLLLLGANRRRLKK